MVFDSRFEQVNESYITWITLVYFLYCVHLVSLTMTTLYLHLSQESLRIFENVFSLERDIAIPDDNTQQLNLWTTVYFLLKRGTLIN